MDNVEIVRNEGLGRFELIHEGRQIGQIEYVTHDRDVVMRHLEVVEPFNGRGLAAALTRAALTDVRARRERVIPKCPYVRGYIKTHPQWRDLVPEHLRSGLGY